jgi:hypothetical protein
LSLQGNKPGDDPKTHGLKFDSDKIRWGLIPEPQLRQVVSVFGLYNKESEYTFNGINITEEFNSEDLLNDIFQSILIMKNIPFILPGVKYSSVIAFKVFLFLRGIPYTKKELDKKPIPESVRWNLLDYSQIERLAKLYTMGAMKYGDYNWKLVDPDRYYDALLRHFKFFRTNEPYDSELGCLHATQVIWNLIAMSWIQDKIPEEIVSASKKMRGLSTINVKAVKKTAKKKAVKKKVAKKKKR